MCAKPTGSGNYFGSFGGGARWCAAKLTSSKLSLGFNWSSLGCDVIGDSLWVSLMFANILHGERSIARFKNTLWCSSFWCFNRPIPLLSLKSKFIFRYFRYALRNFKIVSLRNKEISGCFIHFNVTCFIAHENRKLIFEEERTQKYHSDPFKDYLSISLLAKQPTHLHFLYGQPVRKDLRYVLVLVLPQLMFSGWPLLIADHEALTELRSTAVAMTGTLHRGHVMR